MLSKCANPDCSTPLIYLREGKVFKVEVTEGAESAGGPFLVGKKSPSKVEHFWLCGPCSQSFTLLYDRGLGLRTVPRKPLTRGAAAS